MENYASELTNNIVEISTEGIANKNLLSLVLVFCGIVAIVIYVINSKN